MTDLELGKIVYQAYGDDVGNVNYLGKPMPTWEELPEHIAHAWMVAAVAVKVSIFQWKRDDDESSY